MVRSFPDKAKHRTVFKQSMALKSQNFRKNIQKFSAYNLNSVGGFIFIGTNFRGLDKLTHSWGSKFVAKVFSFIIHTENYHLVGTGIRGSDPPRKLVPHEI